MKSVNLVLPLWMCAVSLSPATVPRPEADKGKHSVSVCLEKSHLNINFCLSNTGDCSYYTNRGHNCLTLCSLSQQLSSARSGRNEPRVRRGKLLTNR